MRLCELRVCDNGLLPTTAAISDIFSSVPHLGDVGNPHKLHPILEGPGKRSGAGGGVGAGGGGGGTHMLNQSFPCAATPLRLPGSPRAERERSASAIALIMARGNAGTRWRRRSARELHQRRKRRKTMRCQRQWADRDECVWTSPELQAWH